MKGATISWDKKGKQISSAGVEQWLRQKGGNGNYVLKLCFANDKNQGMV